MLRSLYILCSVNRVLKVKKKLKIGIIMFVNFKHGQFQFFTGVPANPITIFCNSISSSAQIPAIIAIPEVPIPKKCNSSGSSDSDSRNFGNSSSSDSKKITITCDSSVFCNSSSSDCKKMQFQWFQQFRFQRFLQFQQF